MNWGILISFIVYFIVVLLIGFICYKKTDTLSDYLIGGRTNNTWVTALSAQASDMSSWMLMGLPGALFITGASAAWIGIGLAIGTYVNWLVVAKRLRRYSFIAGDSITLPQFFENRFRDKKGLLRFISAVVIFVFFTIYLASGLSAGGKLFPIVFPSVDYTWALLISLVIVVAYTFLGGFKAVCWTDLFQGILMFIAVLVVPIVLISLLGGVNESVSAMENVGSGFLNLFATVDGTPVAPMEIVNNLAWGLGYMGMPHILIRFMAAKDERTIKTSRRIATVWVVLALVGACLVGLLGRAYLMNGTIGDPAIANSMVASENAETIFIVLATKLFPSIIAGVLISAILAAIMSTADSQLLVVASAFSNDICQRIRKKPFEQKTLVWISRGIIIVVAIIAAVLAWDPEGSSIMSLVQYAWGGFGAAFGPVIILSIFWRRMNLPGAVAGMIVGFATDIIWYNFFATSTGVYELIPAFALAMIVAIVVSLITKEPSPEVLEDFDKMKETA